MEEKQLYGVLTVYRERGMYLRRLEQFEKSKTAYDEAFKAFPDDVRLLIGRSQVCADAVQPAQAFDDAELALKHEPNSMSAKNMQARAMYTMEDFEKSLVINHRGRKLRKQPPYFTTGISQGDETIQDCIGFNAGNVMLDFLPLIKETELIRSNDHDTPKSLHKCRIPRPVEPRKMTQVEARNNEILSRVLAMKYLGPMAYDKFFLKELAKDPRLKSANAGGSKELKILVEETLRSLTERQEMLRSQRPYYTVKLAEKAKSTYQNKFKEEMLNKDLKFDTQTANTLIFQLEQCLTDLRIDDMMKKAELMQVFLDKKTVRTLPAKDKFIDRLYQAVGRGYLSQHRLSYSLSESENRRRIAFLMGMPAGRAKTFDSVMAFYPYKYSDIKIATEKTQAMLHMCENATQRCWLYYEMARLQCSQKNFALCKFYSKRCQREAQEQTNVTWWLNGCIAMMGGDMQQNNTNEIRVAVDEALEYAKKLRHCERLVAFLTKCAEVAADLSTTDDKKAVAQREQQILCVMEEPQRVETQVLFKSISNVPKGRQFKVLPQNMGLPPDKTERHRFKQRGLTVVPGHPAPLRRLPQNKIAGHMIFDL